MKLRCGNTIIYANNLFGKGDETGQHQHDEDGHTTFCFAGSVRIERWPNGVDDPKEFVDIPAGGFAFIAKSVVHNVISLEEDSAYACVWSLRVDESGVELPGQDAPCDHVIQNGWEK